MELQILGDRNMRKLAFSHVVHSIRRMNKNHKNQAKNRALQNILFALLQQEDEARAKMSLITLCELHRRKVWFDDRTANAICMACFHSSSRIMIAALSFLLDYEKIENDDEDTDASSSEDEMSQKPQAVISKETVYKVCPSLLVKKDRGRPVDPKARPKAYGEVNVLSNVPDIELLEHEDEIDGSEVDENSDETASISSDNGNETSDDEKSQYTADGESEDEDIVNEEDNETDSIDEDESEEDNEDEDKAETEELEAEEDDDYEEVSGASRPGDNAGDGVNEDQSSKARKRKLSDFEAQFFAADTSLRALKRLAEAKMSRASSDSTDGILSDEHFQRIKELKAKKEAKTALAQQGFKIPSSDQLSFKRVDPAKIEAHVRLRLSKEERLALVKAGREDRGQYQARAAMKQKKTGGSSNRQKEHKKYMPLAAKKAKAQRSRQEKSKKKQRSGKQFRGKKAWKQ
ncbi:hypothetical protein REPUB_Repub01dG0083300 [Reevesia pubescens]